MADREKVIKGLECHKRAMYGEIDEHGIACNSCPYKDLKNACRATTEGKLIADALALLKEQEPKPPVIKENAYGWKFFYCPSCGREFYADRQHGCVNEAKFCDKCGQAVKWE